MLLFVKYRNTRENLVQIKALQGFFKCSGHVKSQVTG